MKKLPFVLIGLLAWGIILKFGINEVVWDSTSVTSLFEETKKEVSSAKITEILKKIENGKADEAVSQINMLTETDGTEAVRNYLNDFVTYYESDKKQRKITSILNNMSIIKNFYMKEGLDEYSAITRSEVIPFFCIKNFELSVKKPKDLNGICNVYLQNTLTNHLSQYSAVIICLKVRSYYKMEGMGKTDDYISDVQKMIAEYQKYDEIGRNPKYPEEAAYLNRFLKLCDNIRNKHFFDKFDRLSFNMKISRLGE